MGGAWRGTRPCPGLGLTFGQKVSMAFTERPTLWESSKVGKGDRGCLWGFLFQCQIGRDEGMLSRLVPTLAWCLGATALARARAASVHVQEKNEAPSDLQGPPGGISGPPAPRRGTG